MNLWTDYLFKSVDGNRKSASFSWDELFAYKEENYEQRRKLRAKKKITDAYDSFMSQFSQELSLGLDSALRPRSSHKLKIRHSRNEHPTQIGVARKEGCGAGVGQA